jgi:hypothetical protein
MDAFLAAKDQLAYARQATPDELELITRYAIDNNDLALFLVSSTNIDVDELDYDHLTTTDDWNRAFERLSTNPLLYQQGLWHLAHVSPTPQCANKIVIELMRCNNVHMAGGIQALHGELDGELLEALYAISPINTRILLYAGREYGKVISDEVVDWVLVHFGSASDTRLGNLLIRLSKYRLRTVEQIANVMPAALDHFYDWEVNLHTDIVAVASQFILHGRARKLNPAVLVGHPELEPYASDFGVEAFLNAQAYPQEETLELIVMTQSEVSPFYLAGLVATQPIAITGLNVYLERQSVEYRAEYQSCLEQIGVLVE